MLFYRKTKKATQILSLFLISGFLTNDTYFVILKTSDSQFVFRLICYSERYFEDKIAIIILQYSF
ncbi:hypothetical protein Xen7305DRAFT_00026470 [Xenococcus sp. PCC 7305]|nr:hypothetical protein Xen7305DRAFT_00026470 [Xenococcus sp. PCC 7305]